MTNCFAWQSIQLTDTPQPLSPSVFATKEGVTKVAFITCEGEARYRLDGGEPSQTDGHLLRDGGYLILQGEINIRQFKAVNVSDGLTVLQISFERD